jgi:hypothetical protein
MHAVPVADSEGNRSHLPVFRGRKNQPGDMIIREASPASIRFKARTGKWYYIGTLISNGESPRSRNRVWHGFCLIESGRWTVRGAQTAVVLR